MINLRKNQQGIAHVLLVALIVVVVAAIAVVGYEIAKKHKSLDYSSNTNSTSITTATNTAEDSSCLNTYHDANLCHFASVTPFNKLAYTASIQVTNTQGQVSNLTLSSDGKGNTSLNTTSDSQTLDSISLNGNIYIKEGGSTTWIEYPSTAAGTVAPSNPTSNLDATVGASGVTFKADGQTSCGALTCYKYQVIDSATPSATQYVYFDTSKYMLREWQYTDSTSGTSVMTISYQSVAITAPTPVESYTTAE